MYRTTLCTKKDLSVLAVPPVHEPLNPATILEPADGGGKATPVKSAVYTPTENKTSTQFVFLNLKNKKHKYNTIKADITPNRNQE